MAIHAVIFDCRPAYLCAAREVHSVLTLPIGPRNALSLLADALAKCGCKSAQIVPSFEPVGLYEEKLAGYAPKLDLSVILPDQRDDLPIDGSDGDTLLLIDPAYWPIDGFRFDEIICEHRQWQCAVMASGPAAGSKDAHERVVTDVGGAVTKVQRVFSKSAWAQSESRTVPFCAVPRALALNGLQFPLSAMRKRLAQSGIAIRDVPIESAVANLNEEQQLLSLTSATLGNVSLGDSERFHCFADNPEALVAPTAFVSGSARLIGRIVVHSGAVVGGDATVLGPSVIGRGAVVSDGALVANGIVLEGAGVPAGATLHQQVYSGFVHPRTAGGTFAFTSDAIGSEHPFAVRRGDQFEDITSNRCKSGALACKRAFDIAAGSVLLLLLAPMLALVVLLIKLTSRGPVFFCHTREGKNGVDFPCVKFRTMRPDADDLQKELAAMNKVDGPQFKIDDDPRVTPIGRFLRTTNIDELPQLFNVIAGHMSLVGPRPSPFKENQICTSWREARLSVAPGITGMWQICRHRRSEGDFHQWIFYDLAYVKNMSLWLDLKILFYTVVTLGGKRSISVEKVLGRRAVRSTRSHTPAWAPSPT